MRGDGQTDSVCLSGLVVTLARLPEQVILRLAAGSGATWHCGENTGTCGAEHSAAGWVPRSRLTTHFFILSP